MTKKGIDKELELLKISNRFKVGRAEFSVYPDYFRDGSGNIGGVCVFVEDTLIQHTIEIFRTDHLINLRVFLNLLLDGNIKVVS